MAKYVERKCPKCDYLLQNYNFISIGNPFIECPMCYTKIKISNINEWKLMSVWQKIKYLFRSILDISGWVVIATILSAIFIGVIFPNITKEDWDLLFISSVVVLFSMGFLIWLYKKVYKPIKKSNKRMEDSEYINKLKRNEITLKENCYKFINQLKNIVNKSAEVLVKNNGLINDEKLLPYSKDKIKSAFKIYGVLYLLIGDENMFNTIKTGYISISSFQKIENVDKDIISSINNNNLYNQNLNKDNIMRHVDKIFKSSGISLKYMEIINQEGKKDNADFDKFVKSFINDIQKSDYEINELIEDYTLFQKIVINNYKKIYNQITE